MISHQTDHPSTFGFHGGNYHTREILHVALFQGLGFKAERLERDPSTGNFWFCIYPTGGVAKMTLEQAAMGIHDPSQLDGTDAEKVRFYKVVSGYHRSLLAEVKHVN